MSDLAVRILSTALPHMWDKVVYLTRFRPFSTHVAQCAECHEEKEFPLVASECPTSSNEWHTCFEHSEESFEHFRSLKVRETGLMGFWRKLTGTVEFKPETIAAKR